MLLLHGPFSADTKAAQLAAYSTSATSLPAIWLEPLRQGVAARRRCQRCNEGTVHRRRRTRTRADLPKADRDGSRNPACVLAEQALHQRWLMGVVKTFRVAFPFLWGVRYCPYLTLSVLS